jgi:hypothetical protein
MIRHLYHGYTPDYINILYLGQWIYLICDLLPARHLLRILVTTN